MWCPTCGASELGSSMQCPSCGAPVRSAARTAASAVVESTAERGPVSTELPLLGDADGVVAQRSYSASTALTREPVRARLAVASQALPALLWRQPAVRVVAQAGAGALAVSLGVRLLRAWLARPASTRELASSAVPTLRDLLGPAQRSAALTGPRETAVVETVIYVRQTIRGR
jgi:hypothetical protein